VLFRSLRSLAGRALAAGAASAVALTLFNAAQPSLVGGPAKIHPGTLETVKVALTPVPAVASAGRAPSGLAKAAPGSAPAGLESGAVKVGKARFVGFSWPDSGSGTVRLRARTKAGWSAWREVEQAADGPDATSSEYRPGRAYSDGQWLDAGTSEVQVRVDPPATATAGKAGAGSSVGMANDLEAHLITPDLTPTPGTEPGRAGVATAATVQPRIVSRAAWGAD
jgi:hypothetical protein